ncbi:MAG: hypothetical protein ABW061_18735 [Polyangiaceae bacterium]
MWVGAAAGAGWPVVVSWPGYIADTDEQRAADEQDRLTPAPRTIGGAYGVQTVWSPLNGGSYVPCSATYIGPASKVIPL